MSKEIDPKGDVYNRFNALLWHDSRLVSFILSRKEKGEGRGYNVSLRLDLYTDTHDSVQECIRRPTEITFIECRMVQATVDLLGLTYCNGDVSDGYCQAESEFKTRVEQNMMETFLLSQPPQPLAGFAHFHIQLIHPGGDIHILAKGFTAIPASAG
jgi:hypothetical protein